LRLIDDLEDFMPHAAMDSVMLHSKRFGFGAIYDVAARLKAGKLVGRAVITPP